MHIARIDVRSLDETAPAVDLDQTPADVVFLSFTDSDLACARARLGRRGPSRSRRCGSPISRCSPSVLGRPPSREGLRQGALVLVAAARRRGLLALWRRRARGAARGAASNSPCAWRPSRRRAARSSLDLDANGDLRRSGAISTRAARTTGGLPAILLPPTRLGDGGPAARTRQRLRPSSRTDVSRPGAARRAPLSFSTVRSSSPTISRRSRRWRGAPRAGDSRLRASMSRASRTRPRSRRSAP